MKKCIMMLLMLIVASVTFSQVVPKYDRVIDEGIYKSYYSYTVKGPAFVIYKLWHGGGECSRKTMEFHGDLPHYDYRGSGYDKGHMANAEDFAYDCNKEKLTFNYINALPQNPILNRGPWKSMETKVRNSSWTDSLLIVCGGTDFVGCIPSKCFKIVYSLTTHKLLYATIFNNDASRIARPINPAFKRRFSFDTVNKLYK